MEYRLEMQIRPLFREHKLTTILQAVCIVADELEKDLQATNDSEMFNALHAAICEINEMTKPKRRRGYWDWVKNHSSHVFWKPYVKRWGADTCEAVREFDKRMRGE